MEIKINLIPPYRKEKIAQAKRLRLVLWTEVAVTVILILFSFFLLGLGKFLEMNLKAVSGFQNSSSEKGQYEKINTMDKEFEIINSQTGDILAIKKDQFYWSRMLIGISESIISGVSINELASKNYSVFLSGRADSRDNLIKFKEKLENNQCFTDIKLPLSNLVSKENIDFQLDLKMKKDCLYGNVN